MTWCNFPMNGNYHEPSVDWLVKTLVKAVESWDELNNNINDKFNRIDDNIKTNVEDYIEGMVNSGYFDSVLEGFLDTIFINVLHPPYGLNPLNPNGNVDNTDNLQAIIDYLRTHNRYGRIYFPSGSYLFNSTVNVNWRWIDFEGEQESSSRLIINGVMTLFNIENADETMNFISFRRLSISTNTPTMNGVFVEANNVFHLYFQYVRCYNMQKHIVLTDCSTAIIQDCVLQNDTALTLNNIRGIELHGNCNSTYIKNVDITFRSVELGNSCYGILFADKPNDLTIDRLAISGCDVQIQVKQGNSSIPGNVKIVNSDFDGSTIAIQFINLRVTGDLSKTNGCVIANNFFGTRADASSDLVIINNCTDIKIIGNTFTNYLTASIDFIYLFNSFMCAVIGNSLINGNGNVIRVQACTGTSISSNLINCLNNDVCNAITIAGGRNSTIVGNVFRGKFTNAVNATSTSAKCLIVGNNAIPDSGYNGAYVNSSTSGVTENNI